MGPGQPATARVLVVVAVPAEAAAVLAGLPARPVRRGPYEAVAAGGLLAVAAGVGPARAAAAAGTLLALDAYDLVLSAGVGGGFAGRAGPGDLVLADRVVHADLGADSPDGFLAVDRLGLGRTATPLDPGLVAWAAARTGARVGPVLTVSTVTGTAKRAAALAAEHGAAAEAMEGAGVLAAAQAHDVPFLELRAVSNPVGPRDRDAWDLPGALARLGPAVQALTGPPVPTGGVTDGGVTDGGGRAGGGRAGGGRAGGGRAGGGGTAVAGRGR